MINFLRLRYAGYYSDTALLEGSDVEVTGSSLRWKERPKISTVTLKTTSSMIKHQLTYASSYIVIDAFHVL
jgi:hypothetical protein